LAITCRAGAPLESNQSALRRRDTSVRHAIVVEAPIARAFEVFTKDFGKFKPAEHNLLKAEIAETVFEPKVGGFLYDRGLDGSVCRWARILDYDPPNRVLLSWDIGPHWQLETDPSKTSEWEVRFIAESAQRTRVEIEHRKLERHGEGGRASATASPATEVGRFTSSDTLTYSPSVEVQLHDAIEDPRVVRPCC
jgi:hypothetical protein